MTVTNNEWSAFETKLRSYVAHRVEAGYVDDLVGEIMLRLARREADWQTANKPAAWMYRVATNIITDHYRRRAVEKRVIESHEQTPDLEASDNQLPQSSATPSPQQELAQCLLPLLNKLPDQYHQAVQLIDIEGTPQAEAATQLGLSLSAMKSRVQRGRLKLKELLLNCCTIEVNKRGGIVDYSHSPSSQPDGSQPKPDCC